MDGWVYSWVTSFGTGGVFYVCDPWGEGDFLAIVELLLAHFFVFLQIQIWTRETVRPN